MRPTPASDTEAPVASDNSMTMNGVSTMPSRFDAAAATTAPATLPRAMEVKAIDDWTVEGSAARNSMPAQRSEEHTSELQSLMRMSYAVFCLKKKKTIKET